MILVTDEWRHDIEQILKDEKLQYRDEEVDNDQLISYISKYGDPKERFGVLYEKVVNNATTPIEVKVFGRELTQDEAKILAVHFTIKQEQSDDIIEYGNGIVTEALNYLSIPDAEENINGYYKYI